jgi:putative ABC transport system substrate-binding protein
MDSLPVQGASDFPQAIDSATRRQVGALVVVDDVLITTHAKLLLDLANKHRLPVTGFFREFAEAGALLTYGPDIPAVYRRAAYFVYRILKGAKPADLPVEQPTKIVLIINLKTAKVLGLTISQSLLLRADEVIE